MQFPSLRVDGQVALVTGTGTGIGQACALALAAAGAQIVLTELPDRLAAAEATARTIAQDTNAETLVLPLDVTRLNTNDACVACALEHFGRIDILVNNAGINVLQPALEVTEEAWDRIHAVNLKGVFFMSQAVGRVMVAQRSGRIINIASQMGVGGYERRAAYCASKAGVVNLTRVLAIEWARYGVRVNCVGPTFVESATNAALFQDEEFHRETVARIPTGRIAKPADIVGAVVFLASSASDMVNGHTLLVDGGWSAW
ncbi:MAG: glucose 1-dehydrogenase [Chloroflexota bacterium]|nr:glucose 1-dehydrogenase [Chloroflexota bacterium]MDQ6909121.1 glucose 1-dehydrogenase [Chloroflexota bacterium]